MRETKLEQVVIKALFLEHIIGSSDKSNAEGGIIKPSTPGHHIADLNIHKITALQVQHQGPA